MGGTKTNYILWFNPCEIINHRNTNQEMLSFYNDPQQLKNAHKQQMFSMPYGFCAFSNENENHKWVNKWVNYAKITVALEYSVVI